MEGLVDIEEKSSTDVAKVYTQFANSEWERLARAPYQELEFLITMYYLRRYLPSYGIILDAGGGPGRYSLELCRDGRDVVLCDIAQGNIELAKEKLLAETKDVRAHLLDANIGDIRHLDYPSDHFSATLCLGGPLSHLPDPADRQQAVKELVRVTKPGGMVALTGIGYLSILRQIMAEFDHELTNGSLDDLLKDGNTYGPGRMRWHFFRADELRKLAEASGLTTITMVGCQGLSTGLEDATNQLYEDKEKWQRWFDLLLDTASEPAVVDMGDHILYVGRA
jgi:SAM-dependent methyltransferase